MDNEERKAYLILENGKVFKGKSFGAEGVVTAETVFTTGMTGYLETLTDPSYYGQIVVQTFPLIGNYGVITEDFESDKINLSGYIVKDWCREPSNFRSEGDLDTFFKEKGIVGLYDIDTRSLVKILRENGVMNGTITTNLKNVDIESIHNFKITDAVQSVTVKEPVFEKSEKEKFRVVLLDYGLKKNIKRELLKRGVSLTILPSGTEASEVLKYKPDGIFLSNGPGNPEENEIEIKTIKELLKTNIPIFGICMGHQLLALANGFKTEKLKYGHRGSNQPVKNTETGRIYMTSQNHGYTVCSDSIDETRASEWFEHVNDKTCEGIKYKDFTGASVQFHPEACAGPQDTSFLFDVFVEMMEENHA